MRLRGKDCLGDAESVKIFSVRGINCLDSESNLLNNFRCIKEKNVF